MDTTDRHRLPLLSAGQAQKELTHNEALTLIDAVANSAVESATLDVPPAAPVAGACWIVGPSPVGAWAGQAGALALWTLNGWRFVAAVEGMRAYVKDARQWAERIGTVWQTGIVIADRVRIGGIDVLAGQQPAIAFPAGGPVIDAEARTVLAQVIGALRGHGLIAT